MARAVAGGVRVGTAAGREDDALVARAVSRWFVSAARDLPWREASGRAGSSPRRDPYRVLVAEAMLQQTQVSRVVEKYARFIERFPDVSTLARAHEDEVLGAWSGLGYYRRARHLHGAARMIVERFGGRVPRRVDELLTLPGVGRYTAGAVASLAFDDAAPIVDGNVARVLLRVQGREAAADDRRAQTGLWTQAAALAGAAHSPGLFNEGLMELGATVCLPAPATPRCEECPLGGVCAAKREGTQMRIPKPKHRTERRVLYAACVRVEREDGALLIEQRPRAGLWGGLWQAPTLERGDRPPTRSELARAVGLAARRLTRTEEIVFHATHREVRIDVYRTRCGRGAEFRRGAFVARERIGELGLSSPQKRVLLA